MSSIYVHKSVGGEKEAAARFYVKVGNYNGYSGGRHFFGEVEFISSTSVPSVID